MKERPILFSGAMVRAILEGRKTQTRRVVTGKVALEWLAPEMFTPEYCASAENHLCPYGAHGDRLWVRETFSHGPVFNADVDYETRLRYRANANDSPLPTGQKWRPSIFMPRWASRLLLKVKTVRVERLQEISAGDCIAEGGSTILREHDACCALQDQYRDLWDSINAKRGHAWVTNPWVWVVEFEKVPQL